MFADIPGQRRAKAHFARALEGNLSHAYLLAGAEGLGKARFARELGAAIVAACGGCGVCDECDRLRRGLHPDLAVIEREGELIRIEQVERLVAELALKPFVASRRVWILLEAEKLTVEAANKLLKTLEEPPAHVFFLLVSDVPERVLPTIASRCQLVEFQLLADSEVAAYVGERFGLASGEAEALARLARGSVERAERLATDATGARRRARYLKLAESLVQRDADAGRTFVDEVAADERAVAEEVARGLAARQAEIERTIGDPRERAWHAKRAEEQARRDTARRTRLVALDALDHVISWLRDQWVAGLGGEQAVWNRDRLADLAGGMRPTMLSAQLLAAAVETRKDLFLNVDRRLALEAMICRFEEVWHRA